MRCLYVSGDVVGGFGGAGVVTKNELLALEEFSGSNDVRILDGSNLTPSYYLHLGIPFIQDYFTIAKINGSTFDHAHFYSNGFTESVRHLKRQNCIVTYTSPSHDRHESMQEFHNINLPDIYSFPYPHIFDDYLFDQHCAGTRECDQVIATSTLSANFLSSIGCKNITVIPHGVDLPGTVTSLPDNFTPGYIGATGPDKGLVYLIDAWGRLDYKDVSLNIAGIESQGLEGIIRKRTDGGKFKLWGGVISPSDFYNTISLYIQPSISEGFGITVVEAMAHGRPVIVSEGAGAVDMVEDGVNGFRVRRRDVEGIAERVDWFRKNEEQVKRMGAAARVTAESITWDKVRGRYVELFKTLHS